LTNESAGVAGMSSEGVVAPVSMDTVGRNKLVINLLLVATFVVILN
jgi:hypothetical protein